MRGGPRVPGGAGGGAHRRELAAERLHLQPDHGDVRLRDERRDHGARTGIRVEHTRQHEPCGAESGPRGADGAGGEGPSAVGVEGEPPEEARREGQLRRAPHAAPHVLGLHAHLGEALCARARDARRHAPAHERAVLVVPGARRPRDRQVLRGLAGGRVEAAISCDRLPEGHDRRPHDDGDQRQRGHDQTSARGPWEGVPTKRTAAPNMSGTVSRTSSPDARIVAANSAGGGNAAIDSCR